MKDRIIKLNLISIAVLTILFICLISVIFNYFNLKQERAETERIARLIKSGFSQQQDIEEYIFSFSEVDNKYSFVIIQNDEAIGANAQYTDIESLKAAIQKSEILQLDIENRKTLVYPFVIDDTIIVLFNTLDTFFQVINKIVVPLSFFSLLFCLIGLIGLMRLNKNVLLPFEILNTYLKELTDGKYAPIEPAYKYTEINNSIRHINLLSHSFDVRLDEAEQEHSKLKRVLENITQGIILLNEKNQIILINSSAKKIYQNDVAADDNNNSLVQNNKLHSDILEKIYRHENFEHKISGIVYSFEVIDLKDESRYGNKYHNKLLILNDLSEEKRSEKLRSVFFANASHELKTPLTAIKGFSELLSNDYNPKYVKSITKSVERMSSLIDDMLHLSALETLKTDENKQKIDLRDITLNIFEQLELQAEGKNLSLRVHGKGKIFASPHTMVELCINLISNAVSYNKQNGSVDVFIEEEDNYVSYKVQDTGIGIPKKHQAKVFERFYRVDKSRSRTLGGTGLGLSIVKHIAGLYNASISLKSKEGKGTTVEIIFPKI